MRGGLNMMREMVKRKLARKRGEEVQVMLRVSTETRRRANSLREYAIKITLRPTTEVDVVRLAIARGLTDLEEGRLRLGWTGDSAEESLQPFNQIGIRLDPSALERAEALFAAQKSAAYASRSHVLRAALLKGLAVMERDAKEK